MSGILYKGNKVPVRELLVIIGKESSWQNENQNTAFFRECPTYTHVS